MSNTPSKNMEKEYKFETISKVIANVFGPNSSDCCFLFTESDQIIEIKSHRQLLSSLSPVFAAMFNTTWNDDHKPISIVDASLESFKDFLEYFYKGTIKVNTDNVKEVIYLAHKYEVQEAVETCSTYLIEQLSINNVVPYFGMALRYNQEILNNMCNTMICQNMSQIWKSEEFIQCDEDTLKEILVLPASRKEHDVFDACIEWAKDKCRKRQIDESSPDNLRTELNNCLKLIQFKHMDREKFGKRVELIDALLDKTEFNDAVKHLLLLKSDANKSCSMCLSDSSSDSDSSSSSDSDSDSDSDGL